MPWVKRYGKRYYYRGRRVGDQVVSEYFGTGPDAKLAAALDERRHAREAAERRVRKQNREIWDSAASPTMTLIDVCRLLTKAALLAEGFHQHHRGEWRRRQ